MSADQRTWVIWRRALARPIVVLVLVLGVFLPLRQVTIGSHTHSLAALTAMTLIKGGEAAAGDPDASQARKGQEGPIRSAQGLELYQRAFPKAAVPPDGYANGISASNYVTELPATMNWRELGPTYAPNANFPNPTTGASTPVSGRVSAYAVDLTTCSNTGCGTMYAGAANGGVWKTTDGGQTWTPLMDRQLSLAVGSITLDPTNPQIVYVGTGEPNLSCDSHHGIGILRSTDGGQTWTNLGYQQFVNRSVSSIIVDPRTAGSTNATLYVSSTFAGDEDSTTTACQFFSSPYEPAIGVYTSTNGGKTWAPPTSPANVTAGAQSLVMDPSNPNTLYAGFLGAGIYKSLDDGQTWTALTTGLPTSSFDRITLAVAPSNPQVLYASYDLSGHQALYRSTDGGASWIQKVHTPDACDGQCWYDMPLAVDPTNADVVYAGGSANYGYLFGGPTDCATFYPLQADCNTTMMKSTDGGDTWTDVSQNGSNGPLHPDDHTIIIVPNHPNVIYTGNDGGVFRSADSAKSWTDLNKGLGTLQFQGLAVGPTGNIYAGTQDNGTFLYTGSTTWPHVNGGDGGPTATDPVDSNIAYDSYYGAQLFRNDHAGNRTQNVWIAPFWGDYFLHPKGQFYEPYAVAPSRPSDLFYGTYRIWRSTSRGGVDGNADGDATNDSSDTVDWVPISFDLTCATQPASPGAQCGQFNGIASVAVSAVDANVVAVGTSNGQLWLTTNALASVTTDTTCDPRTNQLDVSQCNYVSGPTWTRIDTGLPERYPTSLKFATGSSTMLYVTFSGFAENTPGSPGHVFVSTDSGRSWTNIDGTGKTTSLPDLPVNDIVVNPANKHLYVAADYGVFVSPNGGGVWHRMDFGLPNAPVYQMQLFAPTQSLLVATHGRGIWQGNAR